MSDDNYDDGLVHGHHWASEQAQPLGRPRIVVVRRRDEDYDDGLVHSHGWAVSAPSV